ncbi:hypothetical protein [Klebsiella quasipneumoniae]|uniref:hypothetical protein n=1 Tax=Klebsiella quasipneumoniae TaxID=1463165 RepID=UPI00296EA2FF|nr:hypothetical protein [Klebsiella quasipneumoniae]
MNPYEELFESIIEYCKKTGYSTFDYLPDESQGYPFIMIGDQINNDTYAKDFVTGTSNLTIHVFAEYNYRAEVATIMERIQQLVPKFITTKHYLFGLTGVHQIFWVKLLIIFNCSMDD